MKRGLVLEGGGMRGVFTAGVLDAFLDSSLEFQYVNGVSAGASQGAGFVSRQRGRARQVMTGFIRDPRYFGWRNLLREGNAFGTEFVYRTIPCSLLPFDFDAFNSSPVRFEIGTTDGLTGLSVFWDHRRDPQTMLDILRASCSLPFLARPVILEGAPHMDGGLSDPIPWERALQQGAEFLVVVLTRPAGYRKKPHLPGPATRFWYRKLPGITGALSRRHLVYNGQLDQLEELERAGRALVIRPSGEIPVGRLERDTGRMEELYREGLAAGKNAAGSLRSGGAV